MKFHNNEKTKPVFRADARLNIVEAAKGAPVEDLGSDSQPEDTRIDSPYARYVLLVLLLVYVFNFIDRQILAILAEDIKADLGLSDANMGFLAGTAFIVFYTLFGLPLSRLADIWNRKKLIAIGLGSWSLMTALSGLARGFLPMAFCRFGVAVGEASASPATFSMLYDYFSPKVRTTVLAIYGSGLYIGMGLGLFLGGTVLDAWNAAFPDPVTAPFGLRGWQATFMVVGLPGLLLALWVSTLREPRRGQSDGIVSQAHPHPFREFTEVLMSILPISNIRVLLKAGAGRGAVRLNIAAGLAITLISYGLIELTGDTVQWVAVGMGGYAVVSWMQALAVRDPVVFALIFKCKTLLYISFGGGITLFMGIAFAFWTIPFFQRYYNVSAMEVGWVLGLGNVVMGMIGVILGGLLSDKLRTHNNKGKLYVLLAATIGSALAALLMLTANHLLLAYTAVLLTYLIGAMGYGPAVSTVNDLVIPRARATASAFYYLVTSFIGGALGPYFIGHISDAISTSGVESSEALRQSMMWSMLAPLMGVVLIILAIRYIEADEAGLRDRARALGEAIG